MERYFTEDEFSFLKSCSVEEFKKQIEPYTRLFVVQDHLSEMLSESEYAGTDLFESMLLEDYSIDNFILKLDYLIEHAYLPLLEKKQGEVTYLLETAVCYAREQVVELLLKKGADPNLNSGASILLFIFNSRHFSDKYMNGDGDILVDENITPVRKNIFRMLIQSGCSLHINEVDKNLMEMLRHYRFDHLIPVLQECEPHFTKKQEEEWKQLRIFSLF